MSKWFVLWFTWLSWAWKTTIANNLYNLLKNKWYLNIEYLDWDEIRNKINKDLWYTKKDREENLNRLSYIIKLLSRNNIWVIATFISPYIISRDNLRKNSTNFIEIYINTPLEICEQRDVKWLYKKARNNEIKNFTWISEIYEEPINPEIEIKTQDKTIEESTNIIYNYLKNNNYL